MQKRTSGLLAIAALCASLAAACGPSADSVAAEVKRHSRAIFAMNARTPPTPANLPILRQQIARYRQEHAKELAKLRRAAAKLVDKTGQREQLAVTGFCALDNLLHPERQAARAKAIFRGARTPADAIQAMKKRTTSEGCLADLRAAR